MALTIQSPEDAINNGLVRIGYRLRIGSIWEGTDAAKAALDVYSQTRDAVLRSQNWDFAKGELTLTLLKTAPVGGYMPPTTWGPTTAPLLGGIFEYDYPADCLKVRSLQGSPIFMPVWAPKPTTFAVANDTSFTPARKVIITNLASAIAVYTRQVTDPLTWNASFGEAISAALARRLAPLLASLDVEKLEMADEQAMTQIAIANPG